MSGKIGFPRPFRRTAETHGVFRKQWEDKSCGGRSRLRRKEDEEDGVESKPDRIRLTLIKFSTSPSASIRTEKDRAGVDLRETKISKLPYRVI